MTKPNRSVLRSKNMLRKAYIELSTEKDASKFTVVDVVNRADLSRNTCYAHYPNVNAIAEEIENEFIQKFNLYLDQTLFSQKLDHPLPLLRRFEQFIRSNEEDCRMLVYTQNYPVFLEKLKNCSSTVWFPILTMSSSGISTASWCSFTFLPAA